jgi:hypothetical protein
MSLAKRFPKMAEITAVFAVNALILYSFSLWFSFDSFSRNWILFLPAEDVAATLSYIVAGALLESVLVTASLIFLYFLFPPSWTQGRFILYGTIISAAFLAALMTRTGGYAGNKGFLTGYREIFGFTAACFLAAAVLAEKVNIVRAAIEGFADRATVMLYVYVPLSALALIIIFVRNVR